FRRQRRRRQLDPRDGGAARSAQDQGERDRAEQDRLTGGQGRVRFLAAGAEHGQASRPAGRGGQGGAVPGQRGFFVRLRRQPARRRRRVGDGPVVVETPF